jgi:Flp pilus assembly protein protease CpaA
MTVELVLLLAIFVFVTLPALFGSQHGPFKVFQESGPRLAARVEANMTNGREFAANGGINGMLIGVFGFLAGLAIFLPMVLGKIVGAGDMKLMAAFGIVAGWQAVIGSAFWALVWGAVFGVARVIFSGQGRILFSNLKAIVTLKKRQELVLHRMPFTFAILMGWLSYEVAPGVFQ